MLLSVAIPPCTLDSSILFIDLELRDSCWEVSLSFAKFQTHVRNLHALIRENEIVFGRPTALKDMGDLFVACVNIARNCDAIFSLNARYSMRI
jgi:ribosome biogenesis protein Tsr3